MDIMQEIDNEIAIAESKFPAWPTDIIHASAIVQEEAGELVKATLEVTYEPHKTGRGEVEKEAIQTAAMAIRFLKNLGLSEVRPCFKG